MTNSFTSYISKEDFLTNEIYPEINKYIENSYSYTNFRTITGTINLTNNDYRTIRDTFYVFECIFNHNNYNYHGVFYSDGKNYVKKL